MFRLLLLLDASLRQWERDDRSLARGNHPESRSPPQAPPACEFNGRPVCRSERKVRIMNRSEPSCAICHVRRQGEASWFLLVEKHWEDKLRVLGWDDHLAAQEGVQCACSAFHVQQLVAHWMTTGNLGYPMATSKPTRRVVLPWPKLQRLPKDIEAKQSGGKSLGELSVDRESLNRVLQEQPESLLSVLDALMNALKSVPDELHNVGEGERKDPLAWRQ
jgi:hypothetical protein